MRLVVRSVELVLRSPGRQQSQRDDRLEGTARAWRAPLGTPPDPISTLIGRDSEAEEIAHLLDATRLVTLTGVPGVGKTRLALEAAQRLQKGGVEVCWVDLADLRDATVVPEAVSQALASFVSEPGDVQGVTERHCSESLLLVLDTCEHVLGSCAELVRELVEACPTISVMATSRRPLGVLGERVWRVRALALPASHSAAEVAASDAARLLCERAREVQPAFDPNVDPASVATICRELDGIPLALELAAARLGAVTPAELARKLEDGVRVLSSASPGVPYRHRSMWAAFEWSYSLLYPAQQKALRRLSVFAGDCPLAAAQQVCCGLDLEGSDIVELLAALVDASLVTARLEGTTTYYGMPKVLRRLAAENLAEAGEATSVRSRHLSWCKSLATSIAEGQTDPPSQLAEPGVWQEEIRAGLRWALSEGRVRVALDLVCALSPAWQCRGELAEGRRWFEEVALASPVNQPLVYSRALYGAARFALLAGDVAAALTRGEESLEFARRASGRTYWCLSLLGLITAFARGPGPALALLDEGLAEAETAGDPGSVPELLAGCATSHCLAGDPAATREWFQRCIEVASGLGNRLVTSWAQQGLGWAALATGDLDMAEHLLHEALQGGKELGKRQERAVTLSLLGDVARARGGADMARCYYDEGLARSRAMGARWPLATCLLGLGVLELGDSGPAAARPLFQEAHEVSEASAMWPARARVLNGLGGLELAVGHTSVARAHFEEAFAIATEAQGVREQADALFGLAVVAHSQGEHRQAGSLHLRALAIRLEFAYRSDLVMSIEAVIGLLADDSRWRDAAVLCGAARSARQALKLGETGAFQVLGAPGDMEAPARTHLGEKGFQAAWAEGGALTLEAAASYASEQLRGQAPGDHRAWDTLTRKERQVATLVAQGLTNQEVGERMFISARTVSTHVSHIFEKLQIGSRRQLREAVIARRHDLGL